MSVRPLIFAIPATAAFSLVAAAGLAWMSPASALDSGSDDLLELAQATPPAAPPPAAGGPDRRDRAGVQSQGLLPRPDRPPRRQPHLPQGPARPEGRADDGLERLRQGVRRRRRQGHGALQRAADRDEGAAELRRSPDPGRERDEGARRAHRGGQADACWPSTTRCRRSRRSCSTGRVRWAAWVTAGHHGGRARARKSRLAPSYGGGAREAGAGRSNGDSEVVLRIDEMFGTLAPRPTSPSTASRGSLPSPASWAERASR